MNDRGLNLTPTQMLKGFLLSQVVEEDEKTILNEIWKNMIFELHKITENEDLEFFKSWLRAKYAETIRAGKKGAPNEDFEKIGTRFHSWVRDNIKKIGLINAYKINDFIKQDCIFYVKLYLKINKATSELSKGLESIFYINDRGLASSIYLPLLLAPVKLSDNEKVIDKNYL